MTAMLTKVAFHRATLATALASLVPLAKNKTLPVLACIRMTAEDGEATLEATDLDTRARLRINCEGEGSAILPAALLSQLISQLSSESVSLEIDGTRVTIRGGRSVTKLTSLDAGEWPYAATDEEGEAQTLPGDVLRRLAGVGFVVSHEITRPILNGAYFHAREGKLAAVGTDGHRLLLRESDVPATLDAIIQETGMAYALRLLGEAEEIGIRLSGSYLEFSAAHASIQVRTIEGPFPNYDLIIPRDQDKTAVVDRRDLIASLRRAELIARQTANDRKPPRVTCEFEDERLRLVAGEDAEIDESVALASYTGDPIRIGFNAAYLLEILNEMKAPTVEIRLKAPERAITLTAGEDEGTFLVMPLRLLD